MGFPKPFGICSAEFKNGFNKAKCAVNVVSFASASTQRKPFLCPPEGAFCPVPALCYQLLKGLDIPASWCRDPKPGKRPE